MTPEFIIGEVAIITGIPAPAITGPRSTHDVARARFIAIAAVRHLCPSWTQQRTCDFFRRNNHSSIMKARRRHLELMLANRRYRFLATQVFLSLFACPPR